MLEPFLSGSVIIGQVKPGASMLSHIMSVTFKLGLLIQLMTYYRLGQVRSGKALFRLGLFGHV
jgi:hypothetical protein